MTIYDKLLGYLLKHQIKGRSRIYNLMIKIGSRNLIIFHAKYGIKLYLNPYEYIDSFIINEGFYESEITNAILSVLKGGGTFWDIGANIGIHSIAVKKRLPNTTVYSFEPNPNTLGLLYKNVKLNSLDIKVCGFALFDKAKSMTLYSTEGNSGQTTLTPWDNMTISTTMKCLTTTGDNLIVDGFDLPTVIKLDTEGSELNVLMGCQDMLAAPVLKSIVFEASNSLLEHLDEDKIVLFLKEFGFTAIKQLTRLEKTQHGLSNFIASRPVE